MRKNAELRKNLVLLGTNILFWVITLILFPKISTPLFFAGICNLISSFSWTLGFWWGCDKDFLSLVIITLGLSPFRLFIHLFIIGFIYYINLVNSLEIGICWVLTWILFCIPNIILMVKLGPERWSKSYKRLINYEMS